MTLMHVTHKRARVTGKMGGTAEDYPSLCQNWHRDVFLFMTTESWRSVLSIILLGEAVLL